MVPGIVQSNVFQWNIRLVRYNKAEQYEKTIELFKQMQQQGA
jgi:pentatricopeptide repeat protein